MTTLAPIPVGAHTERTHPLPRRQVDTGGLDPDVLYTTPPCPTAIVIGCPRSGTTLVQALLTACFRDVYTPDQPELRPTPWAIDQIPRPLPEMAVYKVPEMPLFTGHEFREHMRDGVWVIAVVRDLRALSTSKRADGARFFESERHADESWCRMARVVRRLEGGYSRTIVIRFEDMVIHPRDVQLTMAVRMNLLPTRLFEDGYKVMEGLDDTKTKAMQGIRPLDPSRTTIDPATLVSFEAADHLEHFHYTPASIRTAWEDEDTDNGQLEDPAPGSTGSPGPGRPGPGEDGPRGQGVEGTPSRPGNAPDGDGAAGSGNGSVPGGDPSDLRASDPAPAPQGPGDRGLGASVPVMITTTP